ncbi:MAG: single-stranded DNA-binding protein [Huintestinicola sp.]
MLGSCSINKVILMGRLTSDPELRQTTSGVSTCQFTVAITRNFAGQNGEKQSDFITVVAWRQTAEFVCRYFTKGRLILVEGELRTRTYDDKRYPDVRHYVTEVYADNVSFGETKSSAGGGSYSQGGYQNNNYNQPQNNNYGGQGGYSQPAPQQPAPSVSVGDLSDFEEVISDSDLPF